MMSFARNVITLILLLVAGKAIAQPPQITALDTAGKDNVQLVNSERGTIIRLENETINVLVGNVIFNHKGDQLFADSAILNLSKNSVQAYGNVKILQTDGTIGYADRMVYSGNNKTVQMRGNVELNSGADYLWSDNIDYNLATKVGSYTNGGTLQSGNTVVSSKTATYFAKTSDARFKKNVNVLDPDYEVISTDLQYNTKSRLVTFFGPSIINNDSSSLYTTSGTYNAVKELAIFKKRSSIINKGQYMEGDSLRYDRKTGDGTAAGNVIIIDSIRNTTAYCGKAIINEKTEQLLMVQNPYVRLLKDNDSLFYRADTFFGEPVSNLVRNKIMNAQDSILASLDLLQRAANRGILLDSNTVNRLDSLQNSLSDTAIQADAKRLADSLRTTDLVDSNTLINDLTTPLDIDLDDSVAPTRSDTLEAVQASNSQVIQKLDGTLAKPALQINNPITNNPEPTLASDAKFTPSPPPEKPRYLIGYRNVVVYSDSMQARADSLSYSQADSLLHLFYKPILWSRGAQVTGDIITAKVDSNKVEYVKIPQNGILINKSTNANELMYDQIQGNTIWAYFTDNKVDSVYAQGNSASIYYTKDDADAFIGASRATAQDITIYMNPSDTGGRIQKIKYTQDFNNVLTPMVEVNPDNYKLDRFAWRPDERPKSLEEFFKALPRNRAKGNLKNEIQNKLAKPEM